MPIQNLTALHAAIAAVCPIAGVSPDGTIWFDDAATDAQRTAARAAFAAYSDPAPVRQATGKQIFAAISDLGFTAAWITAVSATPKLEDQMYFGSHYNDGIPENNMKIARLVTRAVAAGATGLTVAALFDRAVAEPMI